jgi:hypothetical protein
MRRLERWLWWAALTAALLYGALSFSAPNEHLTEPRPRDRVDRLIDMGQVEYCKVVTDHWDDGVWAAAMGIADAIIANPDGFVPATPDDMPRDGALHRAWATMTEHEKAFYAPLFHEGYAAGWAFMEERPEVLILEPHDFIGRIPLGFRRQLEQGRFERCLREWPPMEP